MLIRKNKLYLDFRMCRGNLQYFAGARKSQSSCKVSPAQFDHVSFLEGIGTCDGPKLLNDNGKEISRQPD